MSHDQKLEGALLVQLQRMTQMQQDFFDRALDQVDRLQQTTDRLLRVVRAEARRQQKVDKTRAPWAKLSPGPDIEEGPAQPPRSTPQ